MYSGGINTDSTGSSSSPPPPVNSAEDANRARDRITGLNGELTEQSAVARTAGEEARKKSEELGQAREKEGRARGDESYARGRARNETEAAEGAQETAEQVEQRVRDELVRLDPEKERILEQFKLAEFQQWMFERELWSSFWKGTSELFLERQQADGEIWRAIFAAFSKLSSAMAGVTPTSASAQLSFATYYSGSAPPNNASHHTLSSAQASQRSIEDQEENIRERLADPYYVDLAAQKAADADAAVAEHDAAQGAVASAERAAGVALAARDAAVEVSNEESDKANQLQNSVRAENAEIEKYNDGIRQEQLDRQRQQQQQQQSRGQQGQTRRPANPNQPPRPNPNPNQPPPPPPPPPPRNPNQIPD